MSIGFGILKMCLLTLQSSTQSDLGKMLRENRSFQSGWLNEETHKLDVKTRFESIMWLHMILL